MGRENAARWALHGALVVGLLGAWGCSRGPESGRYCDTRDPGECVWVDIANGVVTFYDDGRPIDVAATHEKGVITARPKKGPFAGRSVTLRFDADRPQTVVLEVASEARGEGARSLLSYALR